MEFRSETKLDLHKFWCNLHQNIFTRLIPGAETFKINFTHWTKFVFDIWLKASVRFWTGICHIHLQIHVMEKLESRVLSGTLSIPISLSVFCRYVLLLPAWAQIASSCCDNLEQFVVDIGPAKASLKLTQFQNCFFHFYNLHCARSLRCWWVNMH